MARRYHQSKASRMDESLGERRGKESTKRQSMKSRRHESEGSKRRMKHDEHHEDSPERHMGHGDFANMPPHEIFHEYPKEKYNYGAYDDTIHGIDMTDTESADKVDHHPSHQK